MDRPGGEWVEYPLRLDADLWERSISNHGHQGISLGKHYQSMVRGICRDYLSHKKDWSVQVFQSPGCRKNPAGWRGYVHSDRHAELIPGLYHSCCECHQPRCGSSTSCHSAGMDFHCSSPRCLCSNCPIPGWFFYRPEFNQPSQICCADRSVLEPRDWICPPGYNVVGTGSGDKPFGACHGGQHFYSGLDGFNNQSAPKRHSFLNRWSALGNGGLPLLTQRHVICFHHWDCRSPFP